MTALLPLLTCLFSALTVLPVLAFETSPLYSYQSSNISQQYALGLEDIEADGRSIVGCRDVTDPDFDPDCSFPTDPMFNPMCSTDPMINPDCASPTDPGFDPICVTDPYFDPACQIVEADELPMDFALLAAVPNPFNPITTLRFRLGQTGHAKLAVYNLNGSRVATLFSGIAAAGETHVTFEPQNLSSGLYVAVLQSLGSIQTQKLILMK